MWDSEIQSTNHRRSRSRTTFWRTNKFDFTGTF